MIRCMKKHLPQLILFVLFIVGAFLLSFTDFPAYTYEGASKCSLCHSSIDSGDQYGLWLSSGHKQAYSSLSSEKGRAIAKEKKIKNPAQDPKCLSCHLTGYSAPFTMLGPLYRREDGVSCEACHGAGEGYSDFSIMYDREKAIKKGMNPDPKATCVACHDSKAHEMPPFDLDKALKAIAHPIPGRNTAR
jgi:hypothetical protein